MTRFTDKQIEFLEEVIELGKDEEGRPCILSVECDVKHNFVGKIGGGFVGKIGGDFLGNINGDFFGEIGGTQRYISADLFDKLEKNYAGL